ncbi:putative IQ motif; EF-hand binding site [Paratrimastix pyriformis]|uniref:IQ motif n=1 Tax=Paratrimastix pyriformis TaxID=342808 RepID=A0ABQ8U9T2_9EUKA|nr:putative IQ motif; EF-hand binding site [Paratrimastix pyriformis]
MAVDRYHVEDIGKILLQTEAQLRNIRKSLAEAKQTNPELESVIQRAEFDLRSKAEVVLQTVTDDMVSALPAGPRSSPMPFRASTPATPTRMASPSPLPPIPTGPTTVLFRRGKGPDAASLSVSERLKLAKQASLLAAKPNSEAGRALLAHKFGVPESKPARPQRTVGRQLVGQITTGKIGSPNPLPPRSLRRDPRAKKPHPSSEDIIQKGLMSFIERGFLPGKGSLLAAQLGGDKNLFRSRSAAIHEYREMHPVDAEGRPLRAMPSTLTDSFGMLSGVKLDLATPVGVPSPLAHTLPNHRYRSRADVSAAVQMRTRFGSGTTTGGSAGGPQQAVSQPPPTPVGAQEKPAVEKEFMIRNGKTLTNTPEFASFERKHSHQWGPVSALIEALEDLCTRHQLSLVTVDGPKLAALASLGEEQPSIEQLVGCLVDPDTVAAQLAARPGGSQDAAATRIQACWRMFRCRREYDLYRLWTGATSRIQKRFRVFIAQKAYTDAVKVCTPPTQPNVRCPSAAARGSLDALGVPCLRAPAGVKKPTTPQSIPPKSHPNPLLSASAIRAHRVRDERQRRFDDLQETFFRDYSSIKHRRRLHIHLPSLGYDAHIRATTPCTRPTRTPNCPAASDSCMTHTPSMGTCRSGLRICDLIDPLVDVIYVAPFPIEEEVLAYYRRMLEGAGVTNIDTRLRIVVPENYKRFPDHFSLAATLWYSPKTLKRMAGYILGREAILVPGIVGPEEKNIAAYLGVPVWGPDYSAAMSYGSKSGSKRIFALAEVNTFPGLPCLAALEIGNTSGLRSNPKGDLISHAYRRTRPLNLVAAYDMYDRTAIPAALAHLMAENPTIPRWLIKLDDEYNGRGHAVWDVTSFLRNALQATHLSYESLVASPELMLAAGVAAANSQPPPVEMELITQARAHLEAHLLGVLPPLFAPPELSPPPDRATPFPETAAPGGLTSVTPVAGGADSARTDPTPAGALAPSPTPATPPPPPGPLRPPPGMSLVCPEIYGDWAGYVETLESVGGIVEACPAPCDIIGSPVVDVLIEPDGTATVVMITEQGGMFCGGVPVDCVTGIRVPAIWRHIPMAASVLGHLLQIFRPEFRCVGAVLPQTVVPTAALVDAALAIAGCCYKKRIVGAISIDFVAYRAAPISTNPPEATAPVVSPTPDLATPPAALRICAVDLNIGMSQAMAQYKLAHFLMGGHFDGATGWYTLGAPPGAEADEDDATPILSSIASGPTAVRSIAMLDLVQHPNLCGLSQEAFFRLCRQNSLSYDLEERRGSIFHITEHLVRGTVGVSVVEGTVLGALKTLATTLQFVQRTCGPNASRNEDEADQIHTFDRVLEAVRSLLSFLTSQQERLERQRTEERRRAMENISAARVAQKLAATSAATTLGGPAADEPPPPPL